MLEHKYKITAILICLIFFFLALFSSAGFSWFNSDGKYSGNGILADEIPHISGGYYYLKTNCYFLNPEHPPLVKDIAGLGEMIIHPAFPEITNQTFLPSDYRRPEYPFEETKFPKALEWQNNQDHFGVMYLFHPDNNPDQIAFWARLSVIFFNTLLLFALFYFLKKLWSERAALLGLFFFAISQFSLAHGSFVVIDFMSAVLSIIAIVCFALYLKKYSEGEKTTKYFWLASVFFALALLSKFSSVVLVPAAFLGGLIFILTVKKSWKDALKYVWAFFSIIVVTLFLVSLFYAFHVFRMEDQALIQKINESYPEEVLPMQGHDVLAYMVNSNVVTKGLAEYANGVFMVMGRMSVSSQNTYFMGHLYGNEGAGGWYFPVLYLTKLPLGFHFFSLTILILLVYGMLKGKEKFKDRFYDFVANPLAFLLFVFAYCYMLITFTSTFQIGLRHIMPVILAAALLTGKGVNSFWEQKLLSRPNFEPMRLKHLFAIIATLMFFCVICSFPYYLSYYNVLGGGTDDGYKVATDSNYDWGGSDVRRLAEWMKDNNVRQIHTHMFADVPLKYYLGDNQKPFNLEYDDLPPSGSYIAVSVFEYMANVYGNSAPPDRKYTTLQNNLVARVGKTIFVYRVP